MRDQRASIASALDKNGRRQLTLAQVAESLDHRLHLPEVDEDALKAGCRFAVKRGLAAVTCRPEHVPVAAEHLAGSGVDVVTGLGWSDLCNAPVSERAWVEEASRLSAAGATELAVVGTGPRLAGRVDSPFVRSVERLADLQHSQGFRLRVHLDTGALTDEELAASCRWLEEVGVWMVQGGSWRGDRTRFSRLRLMREALGPEVLLKWTTPASSFYVMLLGVAD